MSYTKNTWKAGDTITSAKLNNMEDGIAAAGGGGSNVEIANIVYDEEKGEYVFEKTIEELAGEMLAGKMLISRCYEQPELDGAFVTIVTPPWGGDPYAVFSPALVYVESSVLVISQPLYNRITGAISYTVYGCELTTAE